jgi:transposase-like protein
MTDTTLVDEVMKTDRLGRVKTPPERREALLDEYERGGMSGKAFARHYGIKYQTFASWLQKRRGKRAAGQEAQAGCAGSLRLVEAVIEAGSIGTGAPGKAVRVELPGGASVEVSDARQAELVGRLLRAYSEPARPC